MTSPSLFNQPLPHAPASQTQAERLFVPLGLFVVTLCSTTAVGMRYMYNFHLLRPPLGGDADILPYGWVLQNIAHLADGLPFSLTLIVILLAHEFGHYFACRSFKVASTLPYLLPAPSLSGTFGAVIRLKSRVPSRAALMVIGAAGPIAGFLVSMVGVAVGLAASVYADTPITHVQAPLLITLFHALQPAAPALTLLVPHPVLSASWIGLLITALNLVPAGQLDGGHIVYAISPRAHRMTSRVTAALLLVLGIFFWVGWLLWAVILMLPAMRHPRVPAHGTLKRWHYVLFPICVVILALAGTYQPFRGFGLLDVLHKLPHRYF